MPKGPLLGRKDGDVKEMATSASVIGCAERAHG